MPSRFPFPSKPKGLKRVQLRHQGHFHTHTYWIMHSLSTLQRDFTELQWKCIIQYVWRHCGDLWTPNANAAWKALYTCWLALKRGKEILLPLLSHAVGKSGYTVEGCNWPLLFWHMPELDSYPLPPPPIKISFFYCRDKQDGGVSLFVTAYLEICIKKTIQRRATWSRGLFQHLGENVLLTLLIFIINGNSVTSSSKIWNIFSCFCLVIWKEWTFFFLLPSPVSHKATHSSKAQCLCALTRKNCSQL